MLATMAAADPKAELHRYLQVARDALLWKLDGVSEYDVRRPLVPTGTNLLGLVKHVASVETGYFGDTFGRPFPEPLPWSDEDAEPNADMWATAEQSRKDIVGLYHRVWEHSDATIERLPLDAVGRVPWWPEGRAEVTLHTILIHMIAETDRHAGHADIVRELIDGGAGLRDGNDNMPDADADWWVRYRSELERVARQAGGDEDPASAAVFRTGSRSPAFPDDVRAYIDALDGPHRRLFDHLHELILEELPDASVVISYRMPMYKIGGRHVGLNAGRPNGVTLTTTAPEHIEEFRRRHPEFKANKASIQFGFDDELPDDDIRDVIRRATARDGRTASGLDRVAAETSFSGAVRIDRRRRDRRRQHLGGGVAGGQAPHGAAGRPRSGDRRESVSAAGAARRRSCVLSPPR